MHTGITFHPVLLSRWRLRRWWEVLEGDDPILRQVLANSVEELEEALRRSRIEKATVHFLTGLRRWGYSAPYVPQAGSAGPALRG